MANAYLFVACVQFTGLSAELMHGLGNQVPADQGQGQDQDQDLYSQYNTCINRWLNLHWS